MAHEIKEILKTVFKNKNNWKIKLLQQWPHILGSLATKVRLEKICGDTLVLGVYDSCWLQELYLLSPVLLKTINEKLESTHIKRLRFKQAGIKKIKKSRENKKRSEQKKEITLTQRERDALTKIKDPGLGKALEGFLMQCHRSKDLK